MDALPAHIDRLLACMAQPPSAAHQPLAVPLDPSQLIPLLDHPLLQRWLAALACQQRHGTGVAREKPKASTPEPSVAALFDAFDLQQVELYIYSDACSNHPRAINATHWHDSRHASTDDLAGLIRGDRIDLLLDLTCPATPCRRRPARHRPRAGQLQPARADHAGAVPGVVPDPVRRAGLGAVAAGTAVHLLCDAHATAPAIWNTC